MVFTMSLLSLADLRISLQLLQMQILLPSGHELETEDNTEAESLEPDNLDDHFFISAFGSRKEKRRLPTLTGPSQAVAIYHSE